MPTYFILHCPSGTVLHPPSGVGSLYEVYVLLACPAVPEPEARGPRVRGRSTQLPKFPHTTHTLSVCSAWPHSAHPCSECKRPKMHMSTEIVCTSGLKEAKAKEVAGAHMDDSCSASSDSWFGSSHGGRSRSR